MIVSYLDHENEQSKVEMKLYYFNCSFSVLPAGSSCHTMTRYYGQLSVFVSCHIKMEILLMMAQAISPSLKKLPHPISSKFQFVKLHDTAACLIYTVKCLVTGK